MFMVDVNHRILKFNVASFDVLLNADGLCETLKCEINVKKCLPVLLYGVGASNLDDASLYKTYIAYRKIFRYIFRLSKWAHVTELLNVFGIESLYNEFNRKRSKLISIVI